jgi:hypothetical protein
MFCSQHSLPLSHRRFASFRIPSSANLCRFCVSAFSLLCSIAHPFGFSSPPRPISFRITSFADPHPLTPIESHLCKKHIGGGYRCEPVFRVPKSCLQHPSVTVGRSLLGMYSWNWRRDSCQNAWKVK